MTTNSQQFFDDPSLSGSTSTTVGASRKRHIFFLLSVLVYIASFILLCKWKNFGMGAVAIIPVITTAWLYGAPAGFLAALLSLAANIIMGQAMGIDWYMRIIKTGAGIEGTIGLIAVGVIIGRISDLSRRLKKELSEKEWIEHKLEYHQQRLQEMVEKKTSELSAALQELMASNKELVAREKDLEAGEKRLRSIFETAVDAIITTSARGEIIEWNKAAESIYGYSAAEVLGKPVNMLIPERFHADDSKGMRAALRQGQEQIVYSRIFGCGLRRDGSEFPTEVSQSVWKSAGEVFATGIVRDITEDKKAKEALRESEARLRAIVESAADAIITADSTGEIMFWNRGAEIIYGYAAEEIIGKNISLLVPQQVRQRESEQLDAVFHKKGFKESSESVSVRKDGSEFPVEVTRALWSAAGSTFATAIVRDITGRKKTERDRLLLSSALEQAEENIMILDAQGTIVYVNPAVMRQMKLPAEEILGAKAFQPIDSLYDPQFFADIYAQLLKGGAWKGLLNYKIGDGKTAFIQQALSPVLDAGGRVINILSISRDVTHEQTLEEQLRQAQKMEAIGTLAGGIAHDFNNILAAILGYTELAMLVLPKEGIAAERLRHVISSCDRARSLVKQILAFSRRSQQAPCPIKINTIIKEALKLLLASLPSTIEIQQDIRAADAVVMADPTQLYQLIMNLCSNAAQAMEDSGGILTIGLHDYLHDTNDIVGCYDLAPGAYVRLTVRDTGPGIAPEIKERIFEPFFTTKAVNKGTGMGLAVAHGIVKSCGGCMYADNEPDTGAAFHVLLPRIDEKLMAPPVQQSVEIPHGAETILYVDDEEPVMRIGHGMLESLGYAVVSTDSSQKALEMFRAQPGRFACVITDMTMPYIRGDELARKLLELRPGLRIILCTGFSEKISEEQALQLGIQVFLLKPFTLQELGLAVRKALNGGLHAADFV